MNKLRKVIAHEFRMTAATRAYVVLTILGPFLIIAMVVVPAVVSQRAQRRPIELAAVGMPADLIPRVVPPLGQLGITVRPGAEPRETLEALTRDGAIDGYLLFPDDLLRSGRVELVTREFPDYRVVEILKGAVGQAVIDDRLGEAGLDPARIRALTAPVSVEASQITRAGQRVQQDVFSFIMVGIGFTLMLYMTILLYGQSIGRSVVQEKTSRTVEIVLSSVGERQLLFGKIIGQAAAALAQYTVWVVMALLGSRLLGPRLGLGALPQVSLPILLYLVLFFLLGFLLYAALFGALGAAAEDEQNLGQLSWPLIVVLVFPMVSASPIITAPGSSFSVFLSLLPLTAPVVMFVRILVSDPPAWQVGLAVVLLLAAITGAMFLSARIFRVGILMTGKRFKLREILRWL